MSNKKTIATLFNEIMESYELSAEHKAFITERLAQAEKKNSNRKPTAKQLTNQAVANQVYEFLIESGKEYDVSTLMKTVPAFAEIPDLSNQYATSILTSLRKLGKVERTEIKGKAYYKGIKA